jgi:transcriptional regulator
MRPNPKFDLKDAAIIRRVIRENPWATLVSDASNGLVASHYPVLLDERRDEISILTHVGRPDERIHELGERELLIIVQGPHGYISSSWYGEDPAVPTWNFIVAHLSGIPQILDHDENLNVLSQLVDVFEGRAHEPRRLNRNEAEWAFAESLSQSTVGLRLTPSKIVAKQKMSQNRPPEIVSSILSQLDGNGAYANANLAREMRLARDTDC